MLISGKMAKVLRLLFFTNCVFFELVYGLIGEKVRHAKLEEFTFAVSIAARPTINVTDPKQIANLHFCTGTVVSRKSVLTAAHCLLNRHPDQVEIIAGSANIMRGEKYYPNSWITYDQWNNHQPTRYPHNDIAVITLSGEGFSNPIIYTIPIISDDHDHVRDPDVRLMGWGGKTIDKASKTLKTAWVNVVSNEECSNHGMMLKGSNFTVPRNYFCSKARPWVLSSPGDGGSPVIYNTYQVVGINIGTCPKVEGYPEKMLHELLMNCHLNLHYYKDFLKHAIIE